MLTVHPQLTAADKKWQGNMAQRKTAVILSGRKQRTKEGAEERAHPSKSQPQCCLQQAPPLSITFSHWTHLWVNPQMNTTLCDPATFQDHLWTHAALGEHSDPNHKGALASLSSQELLDLSPSLTNMCLFPTPCTVQDINASRLLHLLFSKPTTLFFLTLGSFPALLWFSVQTSHLQWEFS